MKRLLNFHAVFSNSDGGRYVAEEKLQQSKKLKVFISKYSGIGKSDSTQFDLLCSVKL